MLLEKIENDLKDALKAKDAEKVSTLRFLKSAIQNLSIEKKGKIKDEDVIGVIKKQVKQRKDSIDGFKKGGRQDLVDKETKELEILKIYLPEELKPEELLAIVKEVISETGASTQKDMGKVMKAVMERSKGKADGKTVSMLVNKELSKSAKSDSGEAKEENPAS